MVVAFLYYKINRITKFLKLISARSKSSSEKNSNDFGPQFPKILTRVVRRRKNFEKLPVETTRVWELIGVYREVLPKRKSQSQNELILFNTHNN